MIPLLVFRSALHCGFRGIMQIQGNAFDDNSQQFNKNVVVPYPTPDSSFSKRFWTCHPINESL
jgi:predicted RNA-binding protein with PUA-like domain